MPGSLKFFEVLSQIKGLFYWDLFLPLVGLMLGGITGSTSMAKLIFNMISGDSTTQRVALLTSGMLEVPALAPSYPVDDL